MEDKKTASPIAGFGINLWCAAVGISRASFYNLPNSLRPRTVKLGKRVIVTETPGDYLARVEELQRSGN